MKSIQELANVKTNGVKTDTEINADIYQLMKDVIEKNNANTYMSLEEPNMI